MAISMSAIKTGVKGALAVCSKHSHAVAAGIAIVTMGGAVYKAIKCTETVQKKLEEAEIKKNEAYFSQHNEAADDEIVILDEEGNEVSKPHEHEFQPLDKKEKFAIYAKTYWPVALLAVISAGCMVGSIILAERQIKAMALLATTAEAALDKYEIAANKVLGEEKAGEIRAQVNKDRAAEMLRMTDEDLIPHTKYGNTLFFDAVTGRFFYSSVSLVQQAIDNLNTMLIDGCEFVSLNDYIDAVTPDLDHVKDGDMRGWKEYDGCHSSSKLRMAPIEWETHPADPNRSYAILDIATPMTSECYI